MTTQSYELELVGPREGQTIVLNGHQFVNGVCVLHGAAHELEYAVRSFARFYGAFVRGSDAHKEAVQRIGMKHGGRGLQESEGRGSPEAVPVGTGHPRSDGEADTSRVPGEGNAGDQTGHPGVRSDGDGRTDSGVPQRSEAEGSGETRSPSPGVDLERLRKAVMTLNPEIGGDWTHDGKPALFSVAAEYGDEGFVRADIELAAPDWDRAKAYELKAVQ